MIPADPRAAVVLLDLDRTLVDVETQVDYCAALAALTDAGFAPGGSLGPATSWGRCTTAVIDLLLGLRDRGAWDRAAEHVVPRELDGADRALAMPGLPALRGALAGRTGAIVTLLSADATARVVSRFHLDVEAVVARRFDVPAKPRPEQVLLALDELGVAPGEAVMVGDSERDERAAHAAGVGFIAITNHRHEHRFTTDTIVADLDELAVLMRGGRDG